MHYMMFSAVLVSRDKEHVHCLHSSAGRFRRGGHSILTSLYKSLGLYAPHLIYFWAVVEGEECRLM